MGKERDEEAWPCPCRKGRVVRITVTHDGPYGRPSHSLDVDCAACQKIHSFDMSRSGTVTITLKVDQERKRELSSRAWEAHQEFEREVLVPLRNAIEAAAKGAGRSFDAWYGVLEGPMGLSGGAAELRKSARQSGGLADWLRQSVNASNARKLCELFHVDLPVAKHLANLRKREAERDAFKPSAIRLDA